MRKFSIVSPELFTHRLSISVLGDYCLPAIGCDDPGVGSGTQSEVNLWTNQDIEYRRKIASPLGRLAHELKHAADADLGLSSNSMIGGLPKDEIRAVYYENLVRKRTYNVSNGTYKPSQSRLRGRYTLTDTDVIEITGQMYKEALGGDYDKSDF